MNCRIIYTHVGHRLGNLRLIAAVAIYGLEILIYFKIELHIIKDGACAFTSDETEESNDTADKDRELN